MLFEVICDGSDTGLHESLVKFIYAVLHGTTIILDLELGNTTILNPIYTTGEQ